MYMYTCSCIAGYAVIQYCCMYLNTLYIALYINRFLNFVLDYVRMAMVVTTYK